MKTFSTSNRIPCEILHFCDGDTVFIRAHCPCCGLSKTIYVRLKGIDSYEPKGNSKAQAKVVADKWTKLFKGKNAELLTLEKGSDKYGRVIGSIFIDDKSLAEMLVLNGDAWYYNHKTKRSSKDESNLR